jgi:hypothetical protein
MWIKPVGTRGNKEEEYNNLGFTRLSITKKKTKKKTLLIDSIYISADYAIIRSYNLLNLSHNLLVLD